MCDPKKAPVLNIPDSHGAAHTKSGPGRRQADFPMFHGLNLEHYLDMTPTGPDKQRLTLYALYSFSAQSLNLS